VAATPTTIPKSSMTPFASKPNATQAIKYSSLKIEGHINKTMESNHNQNNHSLMEKSAKKTATFNGGELFWLFNPTEKAEKEWMRRITCALCFVNNFFSKEGINIESIPYKIYLNSTYTETKSLLYEMSQGSFHLQPNAGGAVTGGVLITEQKTNPFMDIHEFIHILFNGLQKNTPLKRTSWLD